MEEESDIRCVFDSAERNTHVLKRHASKADRVFRNGNDGSIEHLTLCFVSGHCKAQIKRKERVMSTLEGPCMCCREPATAKIFSRCVSDKGKHCKSFLNRDARTKL